MNKEGLVEIMLAAAADVNKYMQRDIEFCYEIVIGVSDIEFRCFDGSGEKTISVSVPFGGHPLNKRGAQQ